MSFSFERLYSPPHRWLRNSKGSMTFTNSNSPPHRWLRNLKRR
ncbi:hypothetical protein [uncultured Gammaproteobacteria bacterium]|nr:hypothetical protein [uncultured Gammaproteobacteria bacterium]CAC9997702.1 hypothetical protein [uncultured Gammaproteobacteria bacterium]